MPAECLAEVTDINKQKFLAELSRLLTFMYEEDQQAVLAIYTSLFDDVIDEDALLEFLESPTRQAVMLARAYNAKERKLQVHTSSRADALYQDEDETPAFLEALECMRVEAENRGLVREENQVPPPLPTAVIESVPPVREKPKAEALPTPAVEIPAAPETPEKKTESDSPAEENTFVLPEPPAPRAEEDPAGFSFGTAALEEPPETKKTVILPLAILYAIIAVPVTLAICVVLLVPAFLAIGLTIICGVIGFKVLTAAFGGFYMFSDIMVVLGSGLIILALGLLFLWIFVWFVGGAIAGVINAAIALGSKWCSKEVPVR